MVGTAHPTKVERRRQEAEKKKWCVKTNSTKTMEIL
jgi:hypothetical protein